MLKPCQERDTIKSKGLLLKMKRLKTWGLVGLLILLMMEVLTIAPKKLGTPPDPAVKEVEKEAKKEDSKVATLSQVMEGVHLVETGRGQKEWELDSDSAQGFRDKGAWKLKGVKAKFFSISKSVYSVSGKEGNVETQTKDMFIRGNVVTTTSEGYTFKSESLRYTAQKHTLETPDNVQISGPKNEDKFEMTGRGLLAHVDTSVMDILHNVQAVKAIQSKDDGSDATSLGATENEGDNGGNKMMYIKSLRCHLNGKTSEVHFQDSVQVDLDSVRMTGNAADFLYDKNSHLLTSLLMQGNVKVSDQEHFGASQFAEVLFKEKEFVLYGNPSVTQNGDELHGSEIRFLHGGKEVKVSKAKAKMNEQKSPQETHKHNNQMLTKGFIR
jgi:LPS export ABC transporter protein LptC